MKEAAQRRICAEAFHIIKNYLTDARKSFIEIFFLLPSSLRIYMVNRPVNISKYLGRDFSVKDISKNCHSYMSKKLEPRKHLFQHSEHVILGFNSTAELAQKMGTQKQTDQLEMFLFTKIQFSIVLIFCNYLDA